MKMSSMESLNPSRTTSTHTLANQSINSSNHQIANQPSQQMKQIDHIHSSNCCAQFFYNIPRGSVMVTLPGFAVLLIGAILVATFPSKAEAAIDWTDGLRLISLIFIIVGGALTLGGLAFWIIAWCIDLPQAQKNMNVWKGSTDASLGHQNGDLELVGVYRVDSRRTLNSNHSANDIRTEKVFVVS